MPGKTHESSPGRANANCTRPKLGRTAKYPVEMMLAIAHEARDARIGGHDKQVMGMFPFLHLQLSVIVG